MSKSEIFRLKSYTLVLILAWTLFALLMLLWNVSREGKDALEAARVQARSSIDKDICWNRMF